MNCFPIVFARNCNCFQKEAFQIPTSEFLTVSDYLFFWSYYVSEYLDILKRHYCDPTTGNRIAYCNSNLYIYELNNFLKTLKCFEDFIYASHLENNTIKLNNFTNSVQIGIFIRIFRNYAKNQLEILQYILSSEDSISITKLHKLLEIHVTVIQHFQLLQKIDGGSYAEDLLRELEEFIDTSLELGST